MNAEKPLYQVFLSFRGTDTRRGFSDCLYHFMVDEGIRVFRDQELHPLGEEIVEILEAIRSSEICIPVLSRGYASSKWCLRELTKMVELKKTIIPIFYDVSPKDVKLETNLYAAALWKHAWRHYYGMAKEWIVAFIAKVKREELYYDALTVFQTEFSSEIGQWKEALKKVAALTGREVKDMSYVEFCKSIIKEVLVNLKVKHKVVPDHLVGMDSQVKEIIKILDIKANDVRFVGLLGMSGIGKTTLAKVLFNQLSPHFDACSFLTNIRESSQTSGLLNLQKQLLKDLQCKLVVDIADSDDGIKALSTVIGNKKVLVVLDDVDRRDQIHKLIGSSSWFAPGSRVIVTTRDKRVLTIELESIESVPTMYITPTIWEMKELNSDHALELFSRHAFKSDSPPPSYMDISKEIISSTGHLPLLLEIIGSQLRSTRSQTEWKYIIKKFQEVPHDDIKIKLMISYDALDYRKKQIFLDIACFFINKEKTNPIYMWEACNFHPYMGLEDLVSLSLVKIVDDNKLWMHDLLRDLAREIICLENVNDPAGRSRLWKHKEALDVLRRREGAKKVEALQLSYDDQLKSYTFASGDLQNLVNLRFLKCYSFSIEGEGERLFPKLQWLSWHDCPSKFTMSTLDLENLVILDLSWSYDLTESWDGWNNLKIGAKLKVLDLTNCISLTRTPEFSRYTTLERLILEDCRELILIDPSVGQLKSLRHLNVKGCHSLEGFPEELSCIDALEEIFMEGNQGAFTIPENIGNLRSLIILEVACVQISKLPSSICRLEKLRKLDLLRCSGLEKLPDSFGDLESLVELDISYTTIQNLPNSIGNLEKLKVLKMKECPIMKLPKTIGMLKQLETLDASFTKLRGAFPEGIKGCSNLKTLELSSTYISDFSSIRLLPKLQTLGLEYCHQLRVLPELPLCLTSLNVVSYSLKRVSGQGKLNNLLSLKLFDATQMMPWIKPDTTRMPSNIEWVGKLSNLVTLELHLSNVTNLPTDFNGFHQLKSLELSCPEIELAPKLPSTISRLTLGFLDRKSKWPSLCHLKSLTVLTLYKCSFEDGFESLAIGDLEALSDLRIESLDFGILYGSSLPKNLESLSVKQCAFLKEVMDLSSIKNLQKLQISQCREIREVHGLGETKTLKELEIRRCSSLERLESLVKLEKLQFVKVQYCEKFRDFEGNGGIKSTHTRIV